MKAIKLLFDYIGHAITSLAAVIFVMLMTITGMILFSHTLFSEVFPVGMAYWEKIAATWFMALGWEFTVLLTTCNTRHINKHIPAVMAICSGIIVLFFIQAFDGEQTTLTLVQRWFVGVLAATINYIYAELFYKKWKERNDVIEFPIRVNELQSRVDELQRQLNERESTVNDVRSQLNQNNTELNDLLRFKKTIDAELTCPHCKVVHDRFGTLHAHKGHCSSNPRNKK
jgi:hypothetical protein